MPLVTNVPGTVVQLWPAYVPEGRLNEVVTRLAEVLDVPLRQLRRDVRALENDPLTPVIVKTSVRDSRADYLSEHQTEFPASSSRIRSCVDTRTARLPPPARVRRRDLPGGAEAPWIVLCRGRPDRQVGDRGGVRQLLRGEPGVGQMRVNALGRRQSDPQPSKLPKAGYSVRLTIDADLQRAAEDALQYGIRLARSNGNWAANGGAIVAMVRATARSSRGVRPEPRSEDVRRDAGRNA